jgi:hypothetical protein
VVNGKPKCRSIKVPTNQNADVLVRSTQDVVDANMADAGDALSRHSL